MSVREFTAVAEELEATASRGAMPVAKPYVVLLSGLPGTGKSALAQALRERMLIGSVESDAVRAALFPRPAFSPEESARVFDTCHAMIESLLRGKMAVIFDATNLQERHRRDVRDMADRAGAAVAVVRVHAPPAVVRDRLQQRSEADPSPHLADWSVYRRMRFTVDRIVTDHLRVDTRDGVEAVVGAVLDHIERILSNKERAP